MRIVIVGDFHLTLDQPEIADNAMEDINRVKPDLVVLLGDFGGNGIGSPKGLEQAWKHIRKLNAPIRPILGNHDLQQESGGTREHYSMIEELRKISGGGAVGGGFIEFDDFRLMFASTDPQPADSCWSVQECYVDPQQYSGLMEDFKKRPGVPIISMTHAPPIGCGLRTVPHTHVRATNAYLDQNHDVYRWRKLYSENPEFIMWFSAHYHLGHDHFNSQTNICGTHFFQTQIHGLQTRDETRASRVLDVESDSVTVSTLDHIARELTGQSRWHFDGVPAELMQIKQQKIEEGCQQIPQFTLNAEVLPGGIKVLSSERYLAATADGMLWEIEPSTSSVLGTMHVGEPLSGIAVTERFVWRSWKNKIVRVRRNDLSRFVRNPRLGEADLPGQHYEIPETILQLTETANGVAALGEKHLWIYSPTKDYFERAAKSVSWY